jgi:hypothetical protein
MMLRASGRAFELPADSDGELCKLLLMQPLMARTAPRSAEVLLPFK